MKLDHGEGASGMSAVLQKLRRAPGDGAHLAGRRPRWGLIGALMVDIGLWTIIIFAAHAMALRIGAA